MNRILSIAIVFLAAISANGADRFARQSEGIQISTTGRIVKIDFKNKTIRMRGSDGQAISVHNVTQNISLWMQGVKQRVGGVTLPGGITIALPGRNGKNPPPKTTTEPTNNLEEYTVVITKDTVFQDGSDPIRLEDFRAGEVISIRGTLDGSILTASRIAKWD
jgi:hypothetical protein